MTEMLLLGAGASAEAGVPVSAGLVDQMLCEFRKRPAIRDQLRIAEGLVEHLRNVDTQAAGRPSINIESVINTAFALSDYFTCKSDLRWFGAALDPRAGELSDAPSWLRSFGIDNFRAISEQMQKLVVPAVWIEEARLVEYLSPIVAQVQRQQRLVIATLNYDNSIELLARSHGVPCDTGLATWKRTGVFTSAQPGIFLLKLHGSADWSTNNPDDYYGDPDIPFFYTPKQVSLDEVRANIAADKPDYIPALLLGRQNKLTAEGPFLDLLHAFRTALSHADVLTIVGYSFADEHINHTIARWLLEHRRARVRIIKPTCKVADCILVDDFRRMRSGRVRFIRASASRGLRRLYGLPARRRGYSVRLRA